MIMILIFFTDHIYCVLTRHNCANLLKMVHIEILQNFEISYKNCVSSLLSKQYSAFLITDPFDLAKVQGGNS